MPWALGFKKNEKQLGLRAIFYYRFYSRDETEELRLANRPYYSFKPIDQTRDV